MVHMLICPVHAQKQAYINIYLMINVFVANVVNSWTFICAPT
jgi:hypothetical protein